MKSRPRANTGDGSLSGSRSSTISSSTNGSTAENAGTCAASAAGETPSDIHPGSPPRMAGRVEDESGQTFSRRRSGREKDQRKTADDDQLFREQTDLGGSARNPAAGRHEC